MVRGERRACLHETRRREENRREILAEMSPNEASKRSERRPSGSWPRPVQRPVAAICARKRANQPDSDGEWSSRKYRADLHSFENLASPTSQYGSSQ